ncbi:DUF397 domain-containing protein [Streptomyces sp. NPDC127172]|uniref:DUF397 domain-containing protein n=1 Tax=Streptomyces sp. NPDC127172 TaxID=3345382 RepID=UPI00362E63D1
MNSQHPHFDATTAQWFKSPYSSGDNNCLESAHVPHVVPVRDSKLSLQHGPVILFQPQAWTQFITSLKDRDLPSA